MSNTPKKAYYNGGLVLDFLQSPEYELKDDIHTDALARDYVRMHMQPWEEKASRIFTSRRIQKALFYQYDSEFIRAVRQVYFDGFVYVYEQLKARESSRLLTPAQNNQALLFLSNCFTALPFTAPHMYEYFRFPQLIENKWTLVDYTVQLIELTEPCRALKNKVFAYGFSPLVERRASAHLVFPGTTYVADRGHVTQMRANMDAFSTAGRSIYESGHVRVGMWCDNQNKINKIKTQAHGNSQGGALTLQLAIHQGDKLSEAYALNPPGLYELNKLNDPYDRWEEDGFQRPIVRVQENAGDWVHAYGKRKHEWLRFCIQPPVISSISGLNHVSNFTARAGVKIANKCSRQANEEREVRDVWVYSRLRAFCLYLGYWHYVHIIRPIQFPVVIMLSAWLLSFVLPSIVVTPFLVVVGLACLALAAVDLYVHWTEEVVPAEPHQLSTLRVPNMDLYQTTGEASYRLDTLREYYHVKHEVLKKKVSMPSCNSHVSFFKENGDDYPKMDVLMDSRGDVVDPASQVRIQATYAKLADIRDTLACLDDYHALGEQEARYRAGF
ncbi:MAG: hypothetical protein P1U36_04850 [Legionellaceae bacterium]|nr:hypothetical protein [Legionellaceae bacterium]